MVCSWHGNWEETFLEPPVLQLPVTFCTLPKAHNCLLPAQAPWSTGQMAGTQLGIPVCVPLGSGATDLPFPGRNLPI